MTQKMLKLCRSEALRRPTVTTCIHYARLPSQRPVSFSSSSSSSSSSPSTPLPSTDDLLDGEDESGRPLQSLPRKNLKPSDIVSELDKHIIGQRDAKRAVATALRNRWRRHHLPQPMRADVTPKNILMIGPTGCGKTEIARRLARITDSPFIKVEATKFTEVGFFGKDVDSIIKDLARQTVPELKAKRKARYQERCAAQVEEALLDAIMAKQTTAAAAQPQSAPAAAATVAATASSAPTTTVSSTSPSSSTPASSPSAPAPPTGPLTRDEWRAQLRAGSLETMEVEIEVPPASPSAQSAGMSASSSSSSQAEMPPSAVIVQILAAGTGNSAFFSRSNRRVLPVSEARSVLLEGFLSRLISNTDINKLAVKEIEENGIVFLDEIDKVCTPSASASFRSSADASAEGVQRDLLPLIEGSAISTPIGTINTDHILFICSGAFHSVKPSDLLPELQGRLPVKVELKALDEEDFYRILTVPVTNLLMQQVELLKADDVQLEWSDDAVREIARVAAEVNRTVENIGARRLNTVIARIIEEVSYAAADMSKGTVVRIEKEEVREKVRPLMERGDLSRHIL